MQKFLFVVLMVIPTFWANAADPYPSTYSPPVSSPLLIRDAVILDGEGNRIERGFVHVVDGVIAAIGEGDGGERPADRIVDAGGRYLTPGLIDVHSHLGDFAAPRYGPHSDGNERSSPVTAEVWAEHSVWPQDPQFPLALAGGVTTLQILPGSANLFGGRSVTLKNVRSRTVQGMKFPGAPYGLKMACGENPKRVYGSKGKAPGTRMGNFAGYRSTWIKAQEYQRTWDRYQRKHAAYEQAIEDNPGSDGKEPDPPKRDLQMETLVGVLEGEILVHNHCYRADEMAQIIDLSKEFGYQVTAFHHAVEAYKMGDLLAENGTCAALWADWWRFKMESFDGIPENIAMVHAAGACAIVHSDSAWGIQRLNQEAAKALAAGQKMGLDLDTAEAMRWITLNPAQAMGIAARTGSIKAGKMADLVLWDSDPFSVYSKADQVYIDGVLVFEPATGLVPRTDFELGQRGEEAGL